MTKNQEAVCYTEGSFILEDACDFEEIRINGIDIVGAIYMEYGSVELAVKGLGQWMVAVIEIGLISKLPMVINTLVVIPDKLCKLEKPGEMTEERIRYFMNTCRTAITPVPLTGKALRLYRAGKDKEAIRAALQAKKGA